MSSVLPSSQQVIAHYLFARCFASTGELLYKADEVTFNIDLDGAERTMLSILVQKATNLAKILTIYARFGTPPPAAPDSDKGLLENKRIIEQILNPLDRLVHCLSLIYDGMEEDILEVLNEHVNQLIDITGAVRNITERYTQYPNLLEHQDGDEVDSVQYQDEDDFVQYQDESE